MLESDLTRVKFSAVATKYFTNIQSEFFNFDCQSKFFLTVNEIAVQISKAMHDVTDLD